MSIGDLLREVKSELDEEKTEQAEDFKIGTKSPDFDVNEEREFKELFKELYYDNE